MVRDDQHVETFTLSTGSTGRLTLKVRDLAIQGVMYDIPGEWLGEADIAAMNAAYGALVQIAATNGYHWPV